MTTKVEVTVEQLISLREKAVNREAYIDLLLDYIQAQEQELIKMKRDLDNAKSIINKQ